jgi:CheY-like chemotaxis protein
MPYSQLKHCTILVVEDDERIRKLLELFLKVPGDFYRPIFAASLGEALVLLQRGLRPDIALLDLHLPNGSGLEVPRQIIEATPLAYFPVVLFSGYYDDKYGEEALRLSPRIQTFLAKSRLTKPALLSILRHALLHTEIVRSLKGEVTTVGGVHGRLRRQWKSLEPYFWGAATAIGGGLLTAENDGQLLSRKSMGTFFVALAAAGLSVWKERKGKG